MRQEIRHLAMLLAGKGGRLISSLALTAMLARALGPEGLGRWSMLLAAATVLHSGLYSWTQAASLRFGREEWSERGTLWRTWASRWPFIAISLAGSAALLFLQPMNWLGFYKLDPHDSWIVLALTIALWLSAESLNLFQVESRIRALSGWPILADVALIVSLMAMIDGNWPKTDGYWLLVSAMLMVWWLGAAIAWRRVLPLIPRPTLGGLKKTWIYASPTIPGLIVGYASDWGDQLILAHYTTAADVGVFQASYQALIMFLGLGGAVGAILTPRLIDIAGNDEAIKRLYQHSAPTLLCLWALAIIPLVALGPVIFPLILGSRFSAAVPIIALLLVSVPCSISTFLYGALYTIQGRLGYSLVGLAGVMSLMNIGISLLLVPTYGVMGSAIATSLSYLFMQWIYWHDQSSRLGLPFQRPLAILATLVVFAILQALVPDDIGLRVGLSIIAVVCIVLAARIARVVDAEMLGSLLGSNGLTRGLSHILCTHSESGSPPIANNKP